VDRELVAVWSAEGYHAADKIGSLLRCCAREQPATAMPDKCHTAVVNGSNCFEP
jgi:hypothetical protein